jgi:hypothetical protein
LAKEKEASIEATILDPSLAAADLQITKNAPIGDAATFADVTTDADAADQSVIDIQVMTNEPVVDAAIATLATTNADDDADAEKFDATFLKGVTNTFTQADRLKFAYPEPLPLSFESGMKL